MLEACLWDACFDVSYFEDVVFELNVLPDFQIFSLTLSQLSYRGNLMVDIYPLDIWEFSDFME